MSIDILIPLLSALIGSLIGSLGTIATVFIQTRASKKTEQSKILIQASVEQYKAEIEILRDRMNRENKNFTTTPLVTHLYALDQYIKLIDKDNFTVKEIEKIKHQIRERDSLLKHLY